MKTPRWVNRIEVDAVHDELIADNGGLGGIRNDGLIDSALARPQNLFVDGEPDLAALAASYAFGLAKNHGYIDGNKRTALVTSFMFLLLNGRQVSAAEAEAEQAIIDLAGGKLMEQGFAAWLRTKLHTLSKPAKAG